MRKTQNRKLNLTENVRESSGFSNTSQHPISKSRAATEPRPGVPEMSPQHAEPSHVLSDPGPSSESGSKEGGAEMRTVRTEGGRSSLD